MSNFNHERSLVLHNMSSSGPYVSRLKEPRTVLRLRHPWNLMSRKDSEVGATLPRGHSSRKNTALKNWGWHLYWKQFVPALASISELWYLVYNSSRSLCPSRSERGVCTGGSFCCLALAYDCRAHNAVAAPETSSRLLPTGVVNRSPISPQGPRL